MKRMSFTESRRSGYGHVDRSAVTQSKSIHGHFDSLWNCHSFRSLRIP